MSTLAERGLTLRVRHAACVRFAGKDVENRKTQLCAVGTKVAIHAGAWPKGAPALKRCIDAFAEQAKIHAGITIAPEIDGPRYTGRIYAHRGGGAFSVRPDQYRAIPRSAIIAICEVVAILPATDCPTRPWHLPGQVGHVLGDILLLEKHPLRHVGGQLGAWKATKYEQRLRDRVTLAHGFFVDAKGQQGLHCATAKAALGARASIRAGGLTPRVFSLPDGPVIDDRELVRLYEREIDLDAEAREPWATKPVRKSLAERGLLRPRGRPPKKHESTKPAQLEVGGAA